MSLLDLGAVVRRYWKMCVVLILAGILVGAAYGSVQSDAEYEAQASVTPVDPTGAVAPITLVSTVSPLADRLISEAPGAVDLSLVQSTVPNTGAQVLTFTASGHNAEDCVEEVNRLANEAAAEAAAIYAEINDERVEDSTTEKNEKIKIIELLEAQDGISRALDTGFRVDRSYAYIRFEVSEAVGAKEVGGADLGQMVLAGALGGAFLSALIIALKNLVKRPIRSRRDVEESVDVPVLSSPADWDGAYLWANTCYETGEPPTSVALVSAGKHGSEVEAARLVQAVEASGDAAVLVPSDAALSALAQEDGDGSVRIVPCPSLGANIEVVRIARAADIVILCVHVWDDSLVALEESMRELAIAKAKVVGIFLS